MMKIAEVIEALERVLKEFEEQVTMNFSTIVNDVKSSGNVEISTREVCWDMARKTQAKGGYFRVGNVCIKIAEVTELK